MLTVLFIKFYLGTTSNDNSGEDTQQFTTNVDQDKMTLSSTSTSETTGHAKPKIAPLTMLQLKLYLLPKVKPLNTYHAGVTRNKFGGPSVNDKIT